MSRQKSSRAEAVSKLIPRRSNARASLRRWPRATFHIAADDREAPCARGVFRLPIIQDRRQLNLRHHYAANEPMKEELSATDA